MENVERINTPQTVQKFDDFSSAKFDDFVNALALVIEKYGTSVLEELKNVAWYLRNNT